MSFSNILVPLISSHPVYKISLDFNAFVPSNLHCLLIPDFSYVDTNIALGCCSYDCEKVISTSIEDRISILNLKMAFIKSNGKGTEGQHSSWIGYKVIANNN